MLYMINDGTLMAGGHLLLAHFDLEIKGSEHIAIVGLNGAGKTTLLRLINGELDLERDDRRQGPGIRSSGNVTVGMLRQMPFAGEDIRGKSLRQCCLEAAGNEAGSAADDSCIIEKEKEADRLLTEFGFAAGDRDRELCELSGGQQTKAALIRLLLQKPDILLLDEPTNHLDIESVMTLEERINSYPKAVVIVSHDRFFLDETVSSVSEISGCTLTVYAGNYSAYRAQKRKNAELQQRRYDQQQKEIEKLQELVKRFRGKPRKAAFARTRRRTLEQMKPLPKPPKSEEHIFTGDLLPKSAGPRWVLETDRLRIGYERELLEVSLRVRRGQKIGIIGPNGAGKSTFIRTAAGLIPGLSGRCRLGEGVQAGYFDQMTADTLSSISSETVLKYFMRKFPEMTNEDARKYLASYLFRGKDTARTVAMLSGGERARLALAMLLAERPNLLILDEPTNHMDIPARETLESAFRAYKGTIIFVSHDRYFIEQVAQSLLIFEADPPGAFYYPFGYRHYLERTKALNKAGTERAAISAVISAEDEALISGLKSVPEKTAMQSRQMSTEHAYLDWELRLKEEALGEAAGQLTDCEDALRLLEAGEWRCFAEGKGAVEAREKRKKAAEAMEAAAEKYYALAMEWYDAWQEAEPYEEQSGQTSMPAQTSEYLP